MRTPTRAAALATLACALVVLTAAPAGADPAEPTNYESRVTGVSPATTAAKFEVVGGDSFLRVTVAPGHAVEIPGYFAEPYIRIDADGTVWENEDSPAAYINLDRFGTTDIPDGVDGQGEPQWRQVASGGTYAWHDHRTHWMSPDLPPVVSGSARQLVFPWELPVLVDGQETTISGELIWNPSVSPLAGILTGIIALLPLTLWRRGEPLIPALLVAFAGVLGLALTLAEAGATPAAGRVFPAAAAFPIVGLVAVGLGAILGRTRPKLLSRATLFAALTLAVWSIGTIDVLWRPIVPTTFPVAVARAGVGFILWAAVATAVLSAVNEIVRPTTES